MLAKREIRADSTAMAERNVTDDVLPSAQLFEGEKSGETPATANQPSSSILRTNKDCEEDYKYITGLKLAVVIVSVTLVAFLMMLDLSIIVTVSQDRAISGDDCVPLLIPIRPFPV